MEEYDIATYCLYGEGYGAGVKSGGYYGDLGFILFDVHAEKRWHDEHEITEAAERLGLKRVAILENPYRTDPGVTVWLLEEIADYVSTGQNLVVGINEPREAEGVVARPAVPLFDRRGKRVIFKLKASDYRKGKK